jgi:catechol 2,3-dioxygenase-like lactoylglutathione lyase family enzyme
MPDSRPTLDELILGDGPEPWRALGFAVEGDTCLLGPVRLRLSGEDPGGGLRAWSLRGLASTELDGLSTRSSTGPLPAPGPAHPNGVTGLDHVVAISPDLERSVAALERAGLDLRRIREEPTPAGAPRQAFFRLGDPILELAQEPDEAIERGGGRERPAFFWGLALTAPDLEASVAELGPDLVSGPREAVQPGRRTATLRREAGLGLPVALITPPPAR